MSAVTSRYENAIVFDLRAGSHRRNSLPSDRLAVVDVSTLPFGGRSVPSLFTAAQAAALSLPNRERPYTCHPGSRCPARLSNIRSRTFFT